MIPLNKYILGEAKEITQLKTVSTKSARVQIERIKLEELEAIYVTDALVRNGINVAVELFDCDFEVEAESARVKEETEAFLDFIHFPQLRKEIIKNFFIYGDAWVELIYKNTKLIGAISLNPKRIDYQKTSNNLIELDQYGNPIGYIQKVSMEQALNPAIQKRLITTGTFQGIFLKPEQIARFYFDTVGEGWYGLGLIEPIYSVTLGKNEAEAGLAHIINKAGFPIIINKVGDSEHEPTFDLIKEGAELVKNLNYKTELSIPYYMNIDALKVTPIEKLKEYIHYFIEQQITGLGVPKPIATESGESTNRSTLVTQVKIFMKVNDARRKEFAYQFTNQILTKLAKTNNWNETPKLKPILTDLDPLLEQDVKGAPIIEEIIKSSKDIG